MLAIELSELKVFVKEGFADLNEKVDALQGAIRDLPGQLMSQLPEAVKTNLMENFSIEGVAPVNMPDVRRVVNESESRVMARLEEFGVQVNNMFQHSSSLRNEQPQVEGADILVGSSFGDQPTFRWGGRICCYVPEGFQFPSGIDPKTMWDLWHFGNSGIQVGPYRKMEKYVRFDLDKKGANRFSKTKKLMKLIDEQIVKLGLAPSTEAIESLGRSQADEVFEAGFKEILKELYPDEQKRTKGAGTTVTALRNQLTLHKKRKVGEVEKHQSTENEPSMPACAETSNMSIQNQLQQVLAFPPVSEIRSFMPDSRGGGLQFLAAHKASAVCPAENMLTSPIIRAEGAQPVTVNRPSRLHDRCEFFGCMKKSTYGYLGGVERFCNLHKLEGMDFHCKQSSTKKKRGTKK